MTSEDLMKAMDDARFDPAGRARSIMDVVDENVDGLYRVVDPTSPFMLVWEMGAAAGAHTLNAMDVMTRKRYPSLALTAEDIYLHMTDRDFLGIFAGPPTVPMTFLISRDEILKYAVEVTKGGMKKLTMPKNSNFTYNGYTFTLEYPIEFRIQPTGGMSVVYGSPVNGVLHESDTNLLTWDIVTQDNTDMIRVSATVYQMTITSEVYQLNAATVWNTRIAFSDSYHYCRAYNKVTVDGVTSWKEIQVTYTDQQFDPYSPTILIKVYSGVIEARLPLVYTTSGQVSGELRLDIYTTKATDNVIFDGSAANDWADEWLDLDNEDDGKYTANWSLLSTYAVYSDGYTSGSTVPLTLEELRERVMQHNAGEINLPITNVNLSRVLSDLDYNSVTDIDAITKRVLNATRQLPVPLDGYTVTPMAASTENMVVRLADLNGLDGISHNGDIVTLHPSVLYKDLDGAITIVTPQEIADLKQLKPEAMARAVSSAGYRFSPFHYVLDASDSNFAVRAYYLDGPEITGRKYVDENPTTQLELQTAQTLTVTRVDNGYLIHLLTNSGATYQDLDDTQVQVQLAYTPPGEADYAYLNGTLIGTSDKERIWEFLLETNYEIDSSDALTLKNFQMYADGVLDHKIDLTATFQLIYTVSGYTMTDMKESDIDVAKNRNMLPYDSIGVLQEQVVIQLGNPLKYLWTGSRTVTTAADYQTYPADVLAYWEADDLERNADGSLKVTIVDGKPNVKLLHAKGDPIMADDGVTQKVKYYAGDYVLDQDGNKIQIAGRQLARQIDFTLFDGRYYFANDKSSTDYIAQICTQMQQWASGDMATNNKRALEKTTLYFRPLATTGTVSCVVEGGVSVNLDAEQSLKVFVYMTETGWKNDDLKENIRKYITQAIATEFAASSIALMNIVDDIRENAGSEVLAIRVMGLGGDKNYPLITMADDSARLSIPKKLTALPDGTFTIEEDIDVTFTRHLPALSAA